MRAFSRTVLAASLASAMLAGCTTPYPNGSPIVGANLDANTAPRGSAEFCETYARQTAANTYEESRDTDDGSGYEAFRAKRVGSTAFRRCLAGRTG